MHCSQFGMSASNSLFAAPHRPITLAAGLLSTVVCCTLFAPLACAESSDARASATLSELADGWRRTTHGWERLPRGERDTGSAEVPSQHVTLVQAWPAAWAACLVLAVLSLAAARAERKQVDARAAGSDQFSYQLGRAG